MKWLLVAVIVVILLVPAAYFFYESAIYRNYLKDGCDSPAFCYIKKISLAIPDDYIKPLLEIAKTEGKRINMPKKRQTAISLQRIQSRMPLLVEWYESLVPVISQELGVTVVTTPLTQPNSLCLVIYDRKGDFIDWHFDTNNYMGRYFTLLIPVTFEPTCGHYEYRDASGEVAAVDLNRGEALLFEGDRVYHRGAELCEGQYRVLLSCTFSTTHELNAGKLLFQRVKNLGIFGE